MDMDFRSFGIIGGGAWGTALAQAARRVGRKALLWAREQPVVDAINTQHVNPVFLPDVPLDPELAATATLGDLAGCEAWLLVAPVQHTRRVCRDLAALNAPRSIPVVLCSKGVEQDTLALPTEIVAAELPDHPLAVLSGPTFAAEVAVGQPTALTLASGDQGVTQALISALGSATFRPYASDDMIGAQIGGAIKNVMAVACGIATGAGMGDNARAALITRGLAEITRLGLTMGGKTDTLMGLSGLGDLVLTCSSMQSRNMSLGVLLGQGKALAEVMAARRSVAEGVFTAAAARALATRHGVEMPIVAAVDDVLNRGAPVGDAIAGLLARPFRGERG